MRRICADNFTLERSVETCYNYSLNNGYMMITKEQKIASARRIAISRTIMNDEVNAERTELLEWAKVTGVSVVHIYDKDAPKGGLSVAFRKMSHYTSGIMVEVAVATCSAEDAFSKKTGTLLALRRFNEGEVIALPLNTDVNGEGLNYTVKLAFSAMYFSVN